MSGGLYTLKNIKRCFNQREVLSINHLDLEAGLIYGLLGPNGSGKTTLMKILAFLDEPTGGTLSFQGCEVSRKSMAALRSKVVWSPQFPVMFTGTLRYNIEYPMKIRGVDSRSRRLRAEELLAKTGLSGLAEAPAHRLSGGEAQRASLARAIAAEAEVLLLDEPTANVDAASREGLIRLIENLWRERNLSVIITTHDHSLEADLCQKRIHLMDGRLTSVDEIYAHSARLFSENGRYYIDWPPEAGEAGGSLYISELAANNGEIIIKAATEDSRLLKLKIDMEPDLSLGRQLNLADTLHVKK